MYTLYYNHDVPIMTVIGKKLDISRSITNNLEHTKSRFQLSLETAPVPSKCLNLIRLILSA